MGSKWRSTSPHHASLRQYTLVHRGEIFHINDLTYLQWRNSSPKKANSIGSYLECKSGMSRVLKGDYKVMTGCLKLVSWSHNLVCWNPKPNIHSVYKSKNFKILIKPTESIGDRGIGDRESTKKGNNFGFKYSYLQCKSGSIMVPTSDYKVMTGCLKLVAWSHMMVIWYQMGL